MATQTTATTTRTTTVENRDPRTANRPIYWVIAAVLIIGAIALFSMRKTEPVTTSTTVESTTTEETSNPEVGAMQNSQVAAGTTEQPATPETSSGAETDAPVAE